MAPTPHDDDWNAIWHTIDIRRANLPMSKADFYRVTGVSEGTFRKMEKGVPLKSPEKRIAIARALGWRDDAIDRLLNDQAVTMDDLLDVTQGDAPTIADLARKLDDLLQLVRYMAASLLPPGDAPPPPSIEPEQSPNRRASTQRRRPIPRD